MSCVTVMSSRIHNHINGETEKNDERWHYSLILTHSKLQLNVRCRKRVEGFTLAKTQNWPSKHSLLYFKFALKNDADLYGNFFNGSTYAPCVNIAY